MTLSNGFATQGGAIFNNGQLAIANSTIFSHNAPGGIGGAIDNNGPLTIHSSTFISNTASNGYGGVLLNSSTMTITTSAFTTNTADGGGGIYSGGVVAITCFGRSAAWL